MSELRASPVLTVGETIAGKYRIVRSLGAGGMALVYEAVHLGLDRRVAIKRLSVDTEHNEHMVQRFRREARAIAQIHSPYVARVLDIDTFASGHPFIVLELLEGNDLGEEIDVRKTITPSEAALFVRQAALGMSAAHAVGVVHRDLKPANIFLCKPSEPGGLRVAKVLDFGISKMEHDQDDRRLTRTHEAFGTPQYMSPEQVRNARDVDARSDVWALGIVLYECLAGRGPYEGDAPSVVAAIVADPVPPPSIFAPHIPPGLEAVILRALEKSLSARYQSALELADALEPWAPELPAGLARPPSGTAFEPQRASQLDLAPSSSQPHTSDLASPPPTRSRERDQRTAATMGIAQPSAPTSPSGRRKVAPYVLTATAIVAVIIAVVGVRVAGSQPNVSSAGPQPNVSSAGPQPPPIAQPAIEAQRDVDRRDAPLDMLRDPTPPAPSASVRAAASTRLPTKSRAAPTLPASANPRAPIAPAATAPSAAPLAVPPPASRVNPIAI